jgi:hypothetical protein
MTKISIFFIICMIMKHLVAYQFPFLSSRLLRARAPLFNLNTDKHYLLKADNTVRGTIEENHPLKQLLQKVPQVFAKRNKVHGLEDIPITLKSDHNNGLRTNCGTIGNPDVSALLKSRCSSSSLESIVDDESVRKGRQVRADQLDFTGSTLFNIIREKILNLLKDNYLGSDLDVKLHKLAICEKGDYYRLSETLFIRQTTKRLCYLKFGRIISGESCF